MVTLSETQNMFWGVTLEGEKRYSQIVETAFHISMAALEPVSGLTKEDSIVSVMLQHDQSEFLLCTLEQGKLYQQPLDLNFVDGEEVTFYLTGKGRVHLTGYLSPDENLEGLDELRQADSEEDSSLESEDEAPELETTLETTRDDDRDDDESDEEPTPARNKRKKKQEGGGFKRTKQMLLEAEAEDTDDEDSDGMDVDAYLAGEDFDSDEWETDDDEEEDDEDDLEESFGDKKSPKQSLMNNLSKAKSKKKEKKAETPKSKQDTPKQQDTPQSSPDKAATDGEACSEKKKKKKKKKNKNKGDQTPNGTGEGRTPPSNKKQNKGTPHPGKPDTPASDKKGAGPKPDTPTSSQKPATPASGQKKPKKTTLAGGLVVEELKEGHGPEAKSGSAVGVYYTGKLTNNKVFDSTTSGKPFKFKLGKNEVIKGWDIGVKGMRVGGKRRLTVPAKLAYGSQKLDGIPANSTLVFDVELKNVN